MKSCPAGSSAGWNWTQGLGPPKTNSRIGKWLIIQYSWYVLFSEVHASIARSQYRRQIKRFWKSTKNNFTWTTENMIYRCSEYSWVLNISRVFIPSEDILLLLKANLYLHNWQEKWALLLHVLARRWQWKISYKYIPIYTLEKSKCQ